MQPNGLEYQQCVHITLTTGLIGDTSCHNNKYCSLCELNGSVKFHIRGLPETSPIDLDYYFQTDIQQGGQMTVVGYKQYMIRWIYKNDIWEIFARSESFPVVGTFQGSRHNTPVGIGNWNITSEGSAFDTMQLKLSKVNRNR